MACMMFDTKPGEVIEMKVALSNANVAGAVAALNKESAIGFDAAKKMPKHYGKTSWKR